MAVNVLLSFMEGFLSFISPCILPLLPVYFSYLAGIAGDKDEKNYKNNILIYAVVFVVSFTVVFVIMGAAATTVGMILQNNLPYLRKASGIMMIIFGLYFLGVFKLRFLNREKRLDIVSSHNKVLATALFGLVFAFGWNPCSGPLLISALLKAANSNTVIDGMLLLLAYSVGLGIPFILTAVLFDKLKTTIEFISRNSKTVRFIAGVILIIAGILAYTDSLATIFV